MYIGKLPDINKFMYCVFVYWYFYRYYIITCFQEADEKLWHDEKVQLQIALMKVFDSKSLRNGYVEQVFQQVN